MSEEISQENKPRILLIDDDNISRKTVAAILRKNSYDVVEAKDGEDGLAQFVKDKPDMVLLDVIMPGLNGYQVCEKIRSLCDESIESMPIVMLTGQNDAGSIESAFSAGATDFITKPVNLKLLGQRLIYILRNSQNYKELQDKEEQLDRAQHLARLGYWKMEPATQRISLSEQCSSMMGLNKASGYFSMEELMQHIHPDDRSKISNAIQKMISANSSYSMEHRLLLADGNELLVVHQAEYIKSSKLKEQDYILGTIQDVTELRKAQSEAEYQKYYDGTTGLPNRQSFELQLDNLTTDDKTISAIVFVGIDQFSSLNETIGHKGGDYILKEIAGRLSELEGKGHYVCRFEGHRFAILLNKLNHIDDCENILNKILEKVRVPIQYNDNQHFLTASIGTSIFPIESDKTAELIQWAESALQQAKINGKDQFAFHSAERNLRAQKRLSLEQAMRKGIKKNEFVVFYQPQVSAATSQIIGMEALVRWQHPELGLVPPNDFIPLAEETGLIVPIGEHVLRTACRDTKQWNDKGYSLLVGVNLSAVQFNQPDLIDVVNSSLAESGLDASMLELEVTESMAMQNFDETVLKLQALQEIGIKRSLDDFGTGYSSLSYLQKMPLSTLKVDQSFVRCIECDATDVDGTKCSGGAIAATIINLSNNLDMHVIAEGVETIQQFNFLRNFGDLTLQGFYFSRPIPHEQFEKALFCQTPLPHTDA